MNAYELADEIDSIAKDWLGQNKSGQLANMLRQQADRIAELEETIEACYAVQKMQAEEVYKGNDRIAELEKELKRTKFAWNLAENEIERLSNKDRSGNSISAEEYQKTHEGFSTIIDKTTPQTKPLSDEEIEQCYWGDGYPDNPRCPKDFARAIEAKVRGQ